jgi:hypothetical protein
MKTTKKSKSKTTTASTPKAEARPTSLMAPFWKSHDDIAPPLAPAPAQGVSIRNLGLDATRHALPLLSLYFLNRSIPSYLLLTAFNLALGLMFILVTTRDPTDMTTVDPRSRWPIMLLADLLVCALVLAVPAAVITVPLVAPAFYFGLFVGVDWQTVVFRKAFLLLAGGAALIAGGRAQRAFLANVVVGTVGGSRYAAPVMGNIAEDRSRSKGAYAAQLTLIATFVVLCYVMLTFSSDSYYVLPIIYSLLVVFYDTRPDVARRIFPKLWR